MQVLARLLFQADIYAADGRMRRHEASREIVCIAARELLPRRRHCAVLKPPVRARAAALR